MLAQKELAARLQSGARRAAVRSADGDRAARDRRPQLRGDRVSRSASRSGTVKSRLTRARQTLRLELRKRGLHEGPHLRGDPPAAPGVHDEELPVSDQIAVGAHLEWCDGVRDHVRGAAAAARGSCGPAAQRADASSRPRRAASFPGDRRQPRPRRARTRRSRSRFRAMFDDMHLVYAGVGAAAATPVCVVIMFSMMRFATHERPDSLAGMVRSCVAAAKSTSSTKTPGTNANPVVVDARMLMPRDARSSCSCPPPPRAASRTRVHAVGGRHARRAAGEPRAALGHRRDAEGRQPRSAKPLEALRERGVAWRGSSRRGSPGSRSRVNMVWLVAHTTVRGTKAALDLPVTGVELPTPRKRRVELIRSPRRPLPVANIA